MTTPLSEEKTEVGSYFISNYPPFSFWKRELIPQAEAALDRPSRPETPLGLYLHVPFCRKRCKFCYFRVYTDKNSRQVERYLEALGKEVELYRERKALFSRPLKFVYFGGGTPSFLSERQLLSLVDTLRGSISWDAAEEVTFECEPGTLSERKLAAIKEMGVTRLSLGVENFNDAILEENGRAHHSREIFQAYQWARKTGFDQINVDLIAGMVGETWDNWRDSVKKAKELAPDSLTVYQMELPFNALYSPQVRAGELKVADWRTKREWVDHAFGEMEKCGYHISSAYTVVKSRQTRFVYRDSVWRGADMVGTGVASFSHVGGVHYQNVDGFEEYLSSIEGGRLPLGRALPVSPRELLIREVILQLKLGRLEGQYFQEKFGVNIQEEFEEALDELRRDRLLDSCPDEVRLTREGLLRVDALLPLFFEPACRGARYT